MALTAPTTTILRGIVGSRAYGLEREGSDTDYLGCFVAPSDEFHGLHIPTMKESTYRQTEPYDLTLHEVRKFALLCLDGNPTAMELLWLPDDCYQLVTPEGLGLIAIREKFLSADRVREAYLGYARDQFRRLQERDGTFSSDLRKRTEKHARHLKRLCLQGFELYSTGKLPIRVEDPESYFEFGENVANDCGYAAGMLQEFSHLFAVTPTVLPEAPDEAAVEEWLLEVRARHFYGSQYRHLSEEERAVKYLTYLIDNHAVSYGSIASCRAALARFTNGIGYVADSDHA